MNRPIVIYGAAATAREIWQELQSNDVEVAASCVDRAYMNEKKLFGLPVVPYENLGEMYPPEQFKVMVGVGYIGKGLLAYSGRT